MCSIDLPTVTKSGVCLASGTFFGYVLQKSSVYTPDVIRNAALMQSGTPLKMWLAASTANMAALAILPAVGGANIVKEAKADHCAKGESLPCSVVGGFIHGAGIVICGACPATILVQLGTGTENSLYTLGGYLAGGLLYGFLDEKIASIRSETKMLKRKCTLDDFVGCSYALLAIPLCAGIMTFLKYSSDYLPADLKTSCNCGSIKPGLVLGFVNIPILLAVRKMIGCSSSCITLASQIVPKSVSSKYLDAHRSGFKKWWQVLFTAGAVGGAYIAARGSDSLNTVTGFSGHGVTGVSLLSLQSLSVTATTIAGGVVAVKALQSMDLF
ncbi:uncharacterized protein LOC100368544 [Saccoglossus kowalevskii]